MLYPLSYEGAAMSIVAAPGAGAPVQGALGW